MKKLILLLAIFAIGWIGWHMYYGLDPFARFRQSESASPTQALIGIVHQTLAPVTGNPGGNNTRELQLNHLTQQFHAQGNLTPEQLHALDRLYSNLRRLNQDRERFEKAMAEARARDYATLGDNADQRRTFFIQGIERNWQNTVHHYRPLLRRDLNTLLGPDHQQQIRTALRMD